LIILVMNLIKLIALMMTIKKKPKLITLVMNSIKLIALMMTIITKNQN
jgi:hypothetical protein